MAPRSVARGVPQSGDRAAAGMPDRAKVHVGANSPLRGRIFLWKTLLCPSRSPPMLPQPGWDVALRAVCLVRLLAKGNDPERGPRGPAKRGIGQRRGCQDRAKNLLGRVCIPLRGRIFLRKTLLCPSRSHHSRRRLSRIPSRKTTSRQRRFVQRFLKDTSD
jgi:hypothetical protein